MHFTMYSQRRPTIKRSNKAYIPKQCKQFIWKLNKKHVKCFFCLFAAQLAFHLNIVRVGPTLLKGFLKMHKCIKSVYLSTHLC